MPSKYFETKYDGAVAKKWAYNRHIWTKIHGDMLKIVSSALTPFHLVKAHWVFLG